MTNCIIQKVSNSFGSGYSIHVRPYEEITFYGYTLRRAIKRYRDETGIGRRHLSLIFLD